MPKVAMHWEKYFQPPSAIAFTRRLPKITPHVCRHTFCSKMARKGMDPAKLKVHHGALGH